MDNTSETLEQWRALRAEQDRAYEESLQADRAKVLFSHNYVSSLKQCLFRLELLKKNFGNYNGLHEA